MNASSIRLVVLLSALLRLALVASAACMALLVNEVPRSSILLLVVIGLCTVAPELNPTKYRERAWRFAVALGLNASLLLPISLLLTAKGLTLLHTYYALIIWLITGAIALSVRRIPEGGVRRTWKVVAVLWAFLGEFIWVGDAYTQNREWDFYLGMILGVALLITTKFAFRLPAFVTLTTNTLILILIFLPLLDPFIRPPRHLDPQPDIAGDGYLYETAKRDPQAFRLYWNRYLAQYDRLKREMSFPDPEQKLPYRVRTNIQIRFFQSSININSRGYRDQEVPKDKGDAYRIIALGESNTFGFTLNPEHKPWPEFLEAMIRQRLRLGRPVEVINTGLPNHSLEDNLHRLQTDILALRPDMIISYHGWNGFPWLYSSLPPVFVRHLPDYKRRPLWLLAESEYRLRLIRFKFSLRANPVLEMPSISELVESRYGIAYHRLVQLARTNGIRLVIGNYSMAVNSKSDPQVVEFYREAFPAVYPSIQVNVMHSLLVEEIARRNPEVCKVDTHPHLDGENKKFIDLVHFAPQGDYQMAETFFNSITNILQQDLSRSNP